MGGSALTGQTVCETERRATIRAPRRLILSSSAIAEFLLFNFVHDYVDYFNFQFVYLNYQHHRLNSPCDSHLVTEMFQLFSRDNILVGTTPDIRLVETNGSVEAGRGVGVLREALTSFDEISLTHMTGALASALN